MLVFDKFCADVIQNNIGLSQHVVVPIAGNLKAFGGQDGVSHSIALRRCMLTAIDFNDEARFEANKIKNVVLKWCLPAEFEATKATMTKQAPHRRLGIGWRTAHTLCEVFYAFCDRVMMRSLRH